MKEQNENIGEVFTQPQSGERFLNIHQSQKLQKKRMTNLKGLKKKIKILVYQKTTLKANDEVEENKVKYI